MPHNIHNITPRDALTRSPDPHDGRLESQQANCTNTAFEKSSPQLLETFEIAERGHNAELHAGNKLNDLSARPKSPIAFSRECEKHDPRCTSESKHVLETQVPAQLEGAQSDHMNQLRRKLSADIAGETDILGKTSQLARAVQSHNTRSHAVSEDRLNAIAHPCYDALSQWANQPIDDEPFALFARAQSHGLTNDSKHLQKAKNERSKGM